MARLTLSTEGLVAKVERHRAQRGVDGDGIDSAACIGHLALGEHGLHSTPDIRCARIRWARIRLGLRSTPHGSGSRSRSRDQRGTTGLRVWGRSAGSAGLALWVGVESSVERGCLCSLSLRRCSRESPRRIGIHRTHTPNLHLRGTTRAGAYQH